MQLSVARNQALDLVLDRMDDIGKVESDLGVCRPWAQSNAKKGA